MGERFWMDPPRGGVEKMMLRLAKAYDEYHADDPLKCGAETAIRAANGIACSYWEHMARAALGKPARGAPDMQALLLQAQAQLAEAQRLVSEALGTSSVERAGSLAHEADLMALEVADTLSRAFEAAAEISSRKAA